MSHLLPMQCKYCNQPCIKKGLYNGVQKMYCKACHKYQRSIYTYRLTNETDDTNIVLLTKESMSISSIARYLKMAKTTVGRRILRISQRIPYPILSETNQIYEVDEMQTYIGRRQISCHVYITYAINRITKTVADFIIGPRTKETIGKLIDRLLFLTPKKIYTDGLNIYPSLIPFSIHRCFRYNTNVIERNNLSIRNSLKRLSRKTICFSKNTLMLEACLKIYFWSD
ncbi:MAG: IS1 family transposase [Ferruginibacter sp.]|nr:IS1 family transposase [Ferruginibacter sp.]